MGPLSYSLVIPTFELPDELERTFAGIAAQTRRPAAVIVVDSSRDEQTRELASRWTDRLPLRYVHTESRSAALQRNEGAALLHASESPLVGFMDDDIGLYPETCARVCEVFDQDAQSRVGGVAVRIDEIQRPQPSGWSWWYYRLQAGYTDRTYGGRLFGPAINCLPCYTESEGDLIRADWLNSGCVFYRTALFQTEGFPRFDGYSFMEDVHLSARIARTHELYFHATARCQHRDGATMRPRTNQAEIARMRIRNQRIVARDVLGLRGLGFEAKLLLHKLFATVSVLRRRDSAWRAELLGTWT
ncbi:MAG TPA: glycosyltransferase [Chthoniobacteraceae bacterium]